LFCLVRFWCYNNFTMDDLEFVQRCVKGDNRQTWDEFLKRYSRLIYNYIHAVLRLKGYPPAEEQASDIFQELFCSLIKDNCRKLRSFSARNGCTLASWLRQVSINFTIDYLRKRKPAVSLDAENEEGFGLQDVLSNGSKHIADSLSALETLDKLKECIDILDNDDKYFLQMHIQQGVRLEDLRQQLGVSRGAIDMQKARIIKRLRDCFRSKGFLG